MGRFTDRTKVKVKGTTKRLYFSLKHQLLLLQKRVDTSWETGPSFTELRVRKGRDLRRWHFVKDEFFCQRPSKFRRVHDQMWMDGRTRTGWKDIYIENDLMSFKRKKGFRGFSLYIIIFYSTSSYKFSIRFSLEIQFHGCPGLCHVSHGVCHTLLPSVWILVLKTNHSLNK